MGNGDSDTRRTASEHLVLLLATGLGSGRSRWAPGTVGSVVGLVWAWAVASIPQPFLSGLQIGLPSLRLLVTLVAAAAAIPICTRACRLLGHKDPGQVVLDLGSKELESNRAMAAQLVTAYQIGFIW